MPKSAEESYLVTVHDHRDPGPGRVLGKLSASTPAGAVEAFRGARPSLKLEGVRGVVSFSDPVRRERTDGTVVMPGHIGQVYQALSARFMGRGTPRTLRLLPDGTVFSDRAAQKIRALERGWRYSAAILEAAGAAPLVDGADPREWLALWLPKLTRKLRHPGNLRYGWALQRKVWAVMPPAQDYPKKPQSTPQPAKAA